MTPDDRRRQLLERDLRAALGVPEAAGPGVIDYLRQQLGVYDAGSAPPFEGPLSTGSRTGRAGRGRGAR